jgi:hypothetical protein
MDLITIEYLVKNGYVSYHDILVDASRKGDVQIVTKILALRYELLPKIDAKPLIEACWNDHLAVAALLLQDSRVNPIARDSYVFRQACGGGFTEVVSLFLKNPRVNPAVSNNAPLKCSL